MKLVIGIVHRDDAILALDALVSKGYRVTTSQTRGGFLRKENVTLMSGVQDEQVAEVIQLIQEQCHTRVQKRGSLPAVMAYGGLYTLEGNDDVQVGGAVIFVLDVAQFVTS